MIGLWHMWEREANLNLQFRWSVSEKLRSLLVRGGVDVILIFKYTIRKQEMKVTFWFHFD